MKKTTGFTLIEVVIAIALIAILSAIAYPSYMDYLRRGYRSEGRAALLQAAQWLERASTATGTYPLAAAFPDTLKTIPSGHYTISLTDPSDAAKRGAEYTLTATPQGVQAGDKCGNFTLNQQGLRGAAGVTSGAIVTECWDR